MLIHHQVKMDLIENYTSSPSTSGVGIAFLTEEQEEACSQSPET